MVPVWVSSPWTRGSGNVYCFLQWGMGEPGGGEQWETWVVRSQSAQLREGSWGPGFELESPARLQASGTSPE